MRRPPEAYRLSPHRTDRKTAVGAGNGRIDLIFQRPVLDLILVSGIVRDIGIGVPGRTLPETGSEPAGEVPATPSASVGGASSDGGDEGGES
jgi:hypothetical protein